MFLSKVSDKNIKHSPGGYTNYSRQLVKSMSFVSFLGNGAQETQYFQGINLPFSMYFYSNRENDIPKGFLSSFRIEQLKKVRAFGIFSGNKLSENEILDFFKKLPAQLLGLQFSQIHLSPEKLDTFIRNLPPNLKWLNISNNYFGEVGLKKFREYQKKREQTTGLPFFLQE